jgi:hypothetical protein
LHSALAANALQSCCFLAAFVMTAAGTVDSFLLKKQRQLGKLTAVRIGHDNKGLASGGICSKKC